MPRGIVFFFLVAVWTLRCAAGEPTADESKLKFRALLFPELVFTTADPTNRDGDGKPIPGVRLLPNTFPAEYDFTELLKSYGVSSPPGSLALYFNGALVLRNTPENLDLAAKILAGSDERGNRTSIEVSTYECTFAAGQDLLPWEAACVGGPAASAGGRGEIDRPHFDPHALEHAQHGVERNGARAAELQHGGRPAKRHRGRPDFPARGDGGRAWTSSRSRMT